MNKGHPVWVGTALFFSLPCFGIDSAQFNESLRLLKQSQRATDSKLNQMGVKTRTDFDLHSKGRDLWGSIEKGEGEEEQKQSILIVHDDGKRLRAEAGKLLFGKTLNRLVVSGDDVPAIIDLDQGQGLFSGLRALGKARISGTEGRIAIEVGRIVTRKGTSLSIKGSIQDEAGAYGLEAQVLNSKALAMVGAMAGSFISGLAASQQTMAPTAFGFSEAQPTGRNAILQGVAQTAADQSKRIIEQATQERPILLTEAGTNVILYLDEEVHF